MIKDYVNIQKENIKRHLESIIGPRRTHEELNKFKSLSIFLLRIEARRYTKCPCLFIDIFKVTIILLLKRI